MSASENRTISFSSIAVFGEIFTTPRHWPAFLAGEHDFDVGVALFQGAHKRLPTEEELASPATAEMVAHAKGLIRNKLQLDINRLVIQEKRNAAQEEWRQEREKERKLQKMMADSNKPSELGSIKEIAAKYRLSLSQVRGLKKAGKLNREELLNLKNSLSNND